MVLSGDVDGFVLKLKLIQGKALMPIFQRFFFRTKRSEQKTSPSGDNGLEAARLSRLLNLRDPEAFGFWGLVLG